MKKQSGLAKHPNDQEEKDLDENRKINRMSALQNSRTKSSLMKTYQGRQFDSQLLNAEKNPRRGSKQVHFAEVDAKDVYGLSAIEARQTKILNSGV